MQVCTKCGIEKSLMEFYFRRDINSYRRECIACWGVKSSSYWKKNKEHLTVQIQKWRIEHKELLAKSKHRYQTSERGREVQRKGNHKYYSIHKSKFKAWQAIRHLTKPERCERCRADKYAIDAHHHKGYEKEYWTDVIWLCKPCHVLAHKGINITAGLNSSK